MVKLSNSIVGFLNSITFLLSMPILATGLLLRYQGTSHCEKMLHLPILLLGGFLLVVSVLGLVGAFCRISFFLWLYLIVLLLMIMGLLSLAMFSVAVTPDVLAKDTSLDDQMTEPRLRHYSLWLRRRVSDWETWQKIEDCMKAGKMCGRFIMNEGDNVYMQKLTILQSGCCKPPKYCGYELQNLTYWTVPAGGLRSEDVDCKAWNNDQERLCYGCNSCKAGVLATVKAASKMFTIIDACFAFFLSIVYCVAACALRDNRSSPPCNRLYGSECVVESNP